MLNILKMGSALKAEARRNGHGEKADDFHQYAMERLLSGRKATPKQLFLDFLRSELRQGRNRPEEKKRVHFEFLEEEHQAEMKPSRLDIIYAEEVLGKLEPIDRASLILKNYWGLTELEIGYLFGQSESAICQRLQRVGKRLKA